MSTVPEVGFKGRDKLLHPTFIVGCNYLSLPLMPSSHTTLLMCKSTLCYSNIWCGMGYKPLSIIKHVIDANMIQWAETSPNSHDDVIKWKHIPRYWPFVRRIHRSPENSPHKGQWRGALMFSLICTWINDCVNNREAGDLKRRRAHYDVTVILALIWRASGINCMRHVTRCFGQALYSMHHIVKFRNTFITMSLRYFTVLFTVFYVGRPD